MLVEAHLIELPSDNYQVSNLTVLLMANSFALAAAFAQVWICWLDCILPGRLRGWIGVEAVGGE